MARGQETRVLDAPLKGCEQLGEGQVLVDEVGAVPGDGPKDGEKGRDEGDRRVPGAGMTIALCRGRGRASGRSSLLRTALPLLAWTLLAAPASGLTAASVGPELGFSSAQIAALDEGRVITRVLPMVDREEVGVVGVVRVDVSREVFLRAVRDIVRFQSDGAPQIGMVKEPPASDDFARLSIPARDIRGLRKCRPEDCELKLPAAEMSALRALFQRHRQAASRAINDRMRRWMLGLVRAFMAQGGGALPLLEDQRDPVDPDAEFRRIASQSPLPPVDWPSLTRYVREYPRERLEGAKSVFFWAREDYGLKPTLTLNQAVTYTPPKLPDAVVIWRRLYASHYINGSLAETLFLVRGPSSYVVQMERVRLDMLGGFLGRLYRGRIESGLETRVRKFLKSTRGRLDVDAEGAPRRVAIPVGATGR